MLGYVTADKPELKMREFEVYSGYYCGVCKSIARRYGQIPRIVLSYDAAFLALLLGGLSGEADEPTREHCIAHPAKKKDDCKQQRNRLRGGCDVDSCLV